MKSLLFTLIITTAGLFVFGQDDQANRQARLLNAPAFQLSPEAQTAGIDGTLTLSVSVDKGGRVSDVIVIAGPAWPCGSRVPGAFEQVRNDVKAAVLASTYEPALKNRQPQSSNLLIRFAIGEAYRKSVTAETALKQAENGASGTPKLIRAGVVNGRALKLPRPDYPASARGKRISGTIGVEVLIDETGKVILAGAIDGHRELQMSAREAACNAVFSPVALSGIPVKVTGVITYNFVP